MKHLISLATLAVLAGTTTAIAKSDIVVGMQLEPPNLDPTGGAAAAIDEVVYSNVFEGLTRFNADGSVSPSLAASWDIENNGKTYIFNLRSGVKFHDGTEMDANDVKFSLDRARAEDSTNAQKALFAGIERVYVAPIVRIFNQLYAITLHPLAKFKRTSSNR